MEFSIPNSVRFIIEKLQSRGFEAYPVGGCVRDSLLSRTPNDWDVTTSALPDETLKAFSKEKCVTIGKDYGTIGVVIEGELIEVTTFRVDGDYRDNRHPDGVAFSSRLVDDLSRRDFTINAMALTLSGDVIDCFEGLSDLQNRTIRTVGAPDLRFREDALRILRALRFAAELDFAIEEKTKDAIRDLSGLIKTLSSERVFSEIKRLICARGASRIIGEYFDVLTLILPHLIPKSEESLSNACSVIGKLNVDFSVRFCALAIALSDDPKTAAHEMLKLLKASNELIKRASSTIEAYVALDDTSDYTIKKLLGTKGENVLKDAVAIRRAFDSMTDKKSQSFWDSVHARIDNIVLCAPCLSISDLAIDGRDLLACGFVPSPRLGQILGDLLDLVMRGNIKNDKDELLSYVKKL